MRRKGKVVSYVPIGEVLRPLTAVLAAGAAIVPLTSLESLAQCVSSGAPNFLCSGSNVATQTINANNATVTTNPGFSVDTTSSGGHGIDIQKRICQYHSH